MHSVPCISSNLCPSKGPPTCNHFSHILDSGNKDIVFSSPQPSCHCTRYKESTEPGGRERVNHTQHCRTAFKSPSSSVSVSLSTPLTPGCAPHLTPSVSESHVQPTGGTFHSENKVGIKIFFGSMEQFLTDISFLQSSKLLARYHAVMEVQILL